MSEIYRGGFQLDGTYVITITAQTISADGQPGYNPPAVGTNITSHRGLLRITGIRREFEPLTGSHQVQLEVELIRPGFGR